MRTRVARALRRIAGRLDPIVIAVNLRVDPDVAAKALTGRSYEYDRKPRFPSAQTWEKFMASRRPPLKDKREYDALKDVVAGLEPAVRRAHNIIGAHHTLDQLDAFLREATDSLREYEQRSRGHDEG